MKNNNEEEIYIRVLYGLTRNIMIFRILFTIVVLAALSQFMNYLTSKTTLLSALELEKPLLSGIGVAFIVFVYVLGFKITKRRKPLKLTDSEEGIVYDDPMVRLSIFLLAYFFFILILDQGHKTLSLDSARMVDAFMGIGLICFCLKPKIHSKIGG